LDFYSVTLEGVVLLFLVWYDNFTPDGVGSAVFVFVSVISPLTGLVVLVLLMLE